MNRLTTSACPTLTGHTSYVSSLSILQNENIGSGSDDTIIKIWDSTSFELISTSARNRYISVIDMVKSIEVGPIDILIDRCRSNRYFDRLR